jgi:tetratricopeptide (TPR) repeat protein
MYGFNNIESKRNFEAAISVDSDCAMCYWGRAYASGSNLNHVMNEMDCNEGLRAINEAIRLMPGVSEMERDFILAQASRFSCCRDEAIWSPGSSGKCDAAYALSAGELAHKYPGSPDAQALFAEALMNLSPWKYFDSEGNVSPSIEPGLQALNAALAVDNRHMLALHLYIHIFEQSNTPEKAAFAADTLREYAYDTGLGHLIHMPAHLYFRLGRYQDCIDANAFAVIADAKDEGRCFSPYVPLHNKALLVLGALYAGQLGTALRYSSTTHDTHADSARFVTGLHPTPKELIFTRFGQWNAIKTLSHFELPASYPPYLRVIQAYANALHAIRSKEPEAFILDRAETLRALVALVPPNPYFSEGHVFYPYHTEMARIMMSIVEAALVISVQADYISAVTLLEASVSLQDSFSYMEPEHFYLPVRHCLGAALLAQAMAEKSGNMRNSEELMQKAREVYEADLKQHPHNGWALFGLAQTYRKLRGNSETVSQLESEFESSWANADVAISGTCCELGLC